MYGFGKVGLEKYSRLKVQASQPGVPFEISSFFSVQDDGEEYDCASVLNSHTQDVKRVQWHPENEVLNLVKLSGVLK